MKIDWSSMELEPITYRDYSILCSSTNLSTHVHLQLLAVNIESSFLPTAYFTYQHPLPLRFVAFEEHHQLQMWLELEELARCDLFYIVFLYNTASICKEVIDHIQRGKSKYCTFTFQLILHKTSCRTDLKHSLL